MIMHSEFLGEQTLKTLKIRQKFFIKNTILFNNSSIFSKHLSIPFHGILHLPGSQKFYFPASWQVWDGMWKQYGRVAANTHVDDDQRGQFAFWVIF